MHILHPKATKSIKFDKKTPHSMSYVMDQAIPSSYYTNSNTPMLTITTVTITMSTATEADRFADEKAAADKRIADEADASAAATADWPTGGYNTFTPLLFTFMCAVLVVCIDVSTICLVRAYIIKIQYVISTAYVMFMIYYWIKLIEQLLNFSTLFQV